MKSIFKTTGFRASLAVIIMATLAVAEPVFAVQSASAFTYATRYAPNGAVTGTISPDPDNRGKFIATRTTYDDGGLVTLTEEGVLAAWQDETVQPVSWSGFNVIRSVKTDYDGIGRKLTVESKDSSNQTHTLMHYDYDANNRVLCSTQRMNPAYFSTLPSSACFLGVQGPYGPDRITKFEYNDYGQVLKEYRAFDTPLQQLYVTNVYDPNGRLTDTTDANGSRTHMDYDVAGRVEKMVFPSPTQPSGSPANTFYGTLNYSDYEFYTYDNNGNRLSLRKRDGRTIFYSYDDLNRMKFKDLPGTASDVYYGYYLTGQQQYARFASTTGVGNTSVFNGYGEITSEDSNLRVSYPIGYQYDGNGNRTHMSITQDGGLTFVSSFDGLDRLTSIKDNTASPVVWNHYDDYGRTDRQTTAGNAFTTLDYREISRLKSVSYAFPATPAKNAIVSYEYTPSSQLRSIVRDNNVYRYTEKGSKAGTYTINGLNQYTGVGGSAYGYDLNGNLTCDGGYVEATKACSGTTYTYDIENRLISASGVRNATLAYDPAGRLYMLTSAGKTTYFTYSGDSLIAEHVNGAMTKRYIFGTGVDKPLVSYNGTSTAPTNRLFLHANHQGSIIGGSDNTGAMAYINTYDAYGVPATGNQGRFAYTGQTYLPELGMYYYKARIYYPQVGRFLQTDPIGYKDDMDLYTYVGNDPLNKTDPTGMWTSADSQAMAEVHMFLRDPANREALGNAARDAYDGTVDAIKTGDTTKLGNAATAVAVVAVSARAAKIERHHVVPHSDRRASDARDNMRANGINPKTEKTNLVDISGDKHDITKRESYVTATNERISAQDGADAIKAECCKIANELTRKTPSELDKIYPRK